MTQADQKNKEIFILQEANQYFQSQNYEKSVASYQQAIEDEPQNTYNYWYLGLSLLLQGKEEEAQQVWFSLLLTDNEDELEELSQQLCSILQKEIDHQETLYNYQIASTLRQYIREINPEFLDETVIRLNIGGTQKHPEWKILDIEHRPEVDYVGNAANLEQFADHSLDMIYTSHVLEHFYYQLNDELVTTLKEWYRVLKPSGKLLISVPNLKTLCWLYLNPNLTYLDRHHIMRIMFGGQTNQYDVHKVGFDVDILALYLQKAGFNQYQVVPEFNLFEDCSSLKILNTYISLNVIATK